MNDKNCKSYGYAIESDAHQKINFSEKIVWNFVVYDRSTIHPYFHELHFLLLIYHLKHNSDKRKRKKNTVCTKNVSKDGLKYIGVPQKLTHVKCDRESAIHKPSQNGGKK